MQYDHNRTQRSGAPMCKLQTAANLASSVVVLHHQQLDSSNTTKCSHPKWTGLSQNLIQYACSNGRERGSGEETTDLVQSVSLERAPREKSVLERRPSSLEAGHRLRKRDEGGEGETQLERTERERDRGVSEAEM